MLNDLLQNLLSESFVPHGHCYLWKPSLVWLNVISDSIIFLAYFSIPLQLLRLVRKRGDIPFDWVFCLFGGFIVACGIGHLMDVWTLWHPTYWLSTIIKSFTAAISISTAIVLMTLIPQILKLPSPDQVAEANQKLAAEVQERQEVEEALRRSQHMLQLVLDTFPQRVFWKDQNCMYIGCNKPFARDAGFQSPDEVIGRDDFQMAWQDMASFYQESDRMIMDNRLARINDEEARSFQDGSVTWHRISKLPLENDTGEVIGVLGSYEDITAYKQAEINLRQAKETAEIALKNFQTAQNQLVQSEKMSGLGQLVAGVAHEINNPVNFIYGNLNHATTYIQDLLGLVKLYQQHYAEPILEIRDRIEAIDLDFINEDLPKILSSMKVGADRIRQIVLSLRNFSRHDQSEMKAVDIHEGIDSTLLILQHRLKETVDRPGINVVKNYSALPLVNCYAGQLNQVFMNILSNAIDALEEDRLENLESSRPNTHPSPPPTPTITIHTQQLDANWVQIAIEDNGSGIPDTVKSHLFDPFFTTKPLGKGTGLGLSISYQVVVEKHGGKLECVSDSGQGTQFQIHLPC